VLSQACVYVPPGARDYKTFDGTSLTANRVVADPGVDRRRIKPFSALSTELPRVLGNTPASLAGAASTFSVPVARWYEEPQATAVGLQKLLDVAFDGCLTYTNVPLNMSPGIGQGAFAVGTGTINPTSALVNGSLETTTTDYTLATTFTATYSVNIKTAGHYTINALVNAPDQGSNSFVIDFDAPPDATTAIWDIPLTAGFETLTVAWRGSDNTAGDPAADQFLPKVWNLTAGTHQLIVRGREAGAEMQKMELFLMDSQLPADAGITTIFATAPTASSAAMACTAMAHTFWMQTAALPDIQPCIDVAVTSSAAEATGRRWAYACSSLLVSSPFLTY
jgi:hypothetical protein